MAPLKRNPGTRLQHRQRTAGSEPWCSAHPKTRPWHLCLRHRRCTAASELWGGVRAQGPSCRQNFRAQACLLTLTCILIQQLCFVRTHPCCRQTCVRPPTLAFAVVKLVHVPAAPTPHVFAGLSAVCGCEAQRAASAAQSAGACARYTPDRTQAQGAHVPGCGHVTPFPQQVAGSV